MNVKPVIKSVILHGGVVAAARRSQSHRRQRIASLSQPTAGKTTEPYSYQASIEFLCARGLRRSDVVSGQHSEVVPRVMRPAS